MQLQTSHIADLMRRAWFAGFAAGIRDDGLKTEEQILQERTDKLTKIFDDFVEGVDLSFPYPADQT